MKWGFQCSWLCLFVLAVPCMGQDEADSDTVRLRLGDTQTLVFLRVSPAEYGIDYPDFYVLETEVTNAQFKAFLGGTNKTKDDTDVLKIIEERKKRNVSSTDEIPYMIEDAATIWRDGDYPNGHEEHPVALVTLHDAADFCKWITKTNSDQGLFRLPTWNEWMIAAYGKSRAYPWGDDWQTNRVHTSYGFKWDSSIFDGTGMDTRHRLTEPVKSRLNGRSPEGVYGLLGNVSEYILAGDPTNRRYFNLGSRSMGGGFTDGLFDDKNDRIQPRTDYWGYSHHTTGRECDLGFRVVLDPRKNLELLKRPRIFQQRNKAWQIGGGGPDKRQPE